MENPYASPTPTSDFRDQPALDNAIRLRGMVGHVRVLGILMIIQGVLSLLFGLALIGLGVFAGVMVVNDDAMRRAPNAPSPELIGWFVGGLYGGIGLMLSLLGGLNAYAGWRSFLFRSRTLSIVALCSGVLASFTCYCAPTAIALLIYGLIVLLDQQVREAFVLGEQGMAPEQIDQAFNPYLSQHRQV